MDVLYYKIDNLTCAHCAAKIEHAINKLPYVEEVSINILNKRLDLSLNKDENPLEVIETINQLIAKIEKGVSITPLITEQATYTINGLDCASCASKIEQRLRSVGAIKEVNVDFFSKELTFTKVTEMDQQNLEKTLKIAIDQVEPGLTITRKDDTVAEQEEKNPLLFDFVSVLVAILLFVVGLIIGKDHSLYLPVMFTSYIIVGGEVVYKAIRNIFRGNLFDENFLMALATIGAFGIQEYSEAVAVMMFYQVGELFQTLAVRRSRKSIKGLLSIKPLVANVKEANQIIERKVEEVFPGETIIIRPGERIPLDSVVIEGKSLVDMKALTGESNPVFVEVGSDLLSGCINIDGLLTAKVMKSASDSTVTKVLELVEHASSKKAETEKFITRFARYYTPVVTLAAFLLAIIPPLFFGGIWTVWLSRAFIFLVISCPCALVISIPLGFFGGIGRASKQGILVKGGNHLEALNDVSTIIFDKTGTLTKGNFAVVAIHVDHSSYSKESLLELAAHIENHSNHPIAQSIVSAYKGTINLNFAQNIQEVAGHGLIAVVNDERVFVGNHRLLAMHGINHPVVQEVGTVIYIAVDDHYIGYILIQDELKPEAKHALQTLRTRGIKQLILLTGDQIEVAELIGKELNLDRVHANLLPEDKLTLLEAIMDRTTGKVMYVGDGINDTPVLARSDVAMAMGGVGSDAAIEVSDIIIMNDELIKIPEAFVIAKQTNRIVWQNIVFALGIKFFFLVIGAFGLTTMWQAVFADVGVSIIAILNSFRILYMRKSIKN